MTGPERLDGILRRVLPELRPPSPGTAPNGPRAAGAESGAIAGGPFLAAAMSELERALAGRTTDELVKLGRRLLKQSPELLKLAGGALMASAEDAFEFRGQDGGFLEQTCSVGLVLMQKDDADLIAGFLGLNVESATWDHEPVTAGRMMGIDP